MRTAGDVVTRRHADDRYPEVGQVLDELDELIALRRAVDARVSA